MNSSSTGAWEPPAPYIQYKAKKNHFYCSRKKKNDSFYSCTTQIYINSFKKTAIPQIRGAEGKTD
jgi:hypothetical protein